jgi:hypothetical protein
VWCCAERATRCSYGRCRQRHHVELEQQRWQHDFRRRWPDPPSRQHPNRRHVRRAAQWIDWQLKQKNEVRSLFVGPDCGFCKGSTWKTLLSKGF